MKSITSLVNRMYRTASNYIFTNYHDAFWKFYGNVQLQVNNQVIICHDIKEEASELKIWIKNERQK